MIRLNYCAGAGTQHALGIARVGPDEVGDSAGRSVTSRDLLAKRLQLVERVTGDPDGTVIHLRQGLLKLCGQTFRLDVLPDLRLTQPVEQPQQVGVLVGRQPKQQLAHVVAVARGRLEEVAIGLNLRSQALHAQRAGLVLELKVAADLPGGGEEPCNGLPSRVGGADADPACHRNRLAVLILPGELDPEVPGAARSGIPIGHQPQQAGVMAPRCCHPELVAVEDKRKQHLQSLGLASTVCPSQQEAPAREGEDLLVVLPHVQDAASAEPEAGGVAGAGHWSSWSRSNNDRSPLLDASANVCLLYTS